MNHSLVATIRNFPVGVGFLFMFAKVFRIFFARRIANPREPSWAAIEGTEGRHSEWPQSVGQSPLSPPSVPLDDLDYLRAAHEGANPNPPYPISPAPRREETDWGIHASDTDHE